MVKHKATVNNPDLKFSYNATPLDEKVQTDEACQEKKITLNTMSLTSKCIVISQWSSSIKLFQKKKRCRFKGKK